jgi:hypothetical protein
MDDSIKRSIEQLQDAISELRVELERLKGTAEIGNSDVDKDIDYVCWVVYK